MSVLVGVRTRSARLSKKELLVHGTSILATATAGLSRWDAGRPCSGRAGSHLTNAGVSGGFHHSPL